MTVPSTTRKAGPYTGNGVQTVYPFSFKVFAATDIKVVQADLAGVETTLSSGYTVSVNSDQVASPGGNVTMTTAPATGYKLSVLGNLPYDQTLAIPGGGNFNPVAVENALDRIVEQLQQVAEAGSRALALPASATASGTLPAPVANKLLGWDSLGAALQNIDATTLATIVAFGTANADIFTGTGAQTVFTLSANPGAQANLDVSVGGVTQYPGLDYTWSGGTTVTFAVAPPNGVKVLLRYFQGLPQGTTDSAASTYTPAGTGAVQTLVQTKLRERVSVKDFGAKGDGVTDDSAAFQSGLNWCFARGLELEVPAGGIYLIGTGLTITYDGSGTQALRIRGACGTNYNANGTGAVIKFTHATADCITIGGVGPVMVDIEGVSFRGTGTGCCVSGTNVWMINVQRNTFYGMGYGIKLKASTSAQAFAGDVRIENNRFEALQTAHILLTGDNGLGQINVVSIQKNNFLDGATHISSNWGGNQAYLHNIIIKENDFENWSVNAIAFDRGAQNVTIQNNYFERGGSSFTANWINFSTGGYSSLAVLDNSFVGTLNAASQTFCYVVNTNGFKFLGNQAANGGLTDRFSTDIVVSTGVDAEPCFTQYGAGTTPYPARVMNYVINSRVNETWMQAMPTGSGKWVGISSGDGYPGGTVATLNINQISKTNGMVSVVSKSTIATKSGAGTSLLLGALPYANAGGELWFPVYTTNVTGTGPFHGILPNGSTVATVYDANNAAVNYQTACSVGSVVVANFSYPTQN